MKLFSIYCNFVQRAIISSTSKFEAFIAFTYKKYQVTSPMGLRNNTNYLQILEGSNAKYSTSVSKTLLRKIVTKIKKENHCVLDAADKFELRFVNHTFSASFWLLGYAKVLSLCYPGHRLGICQGFNFGATAAGLCGQFFCMPANNYQSSPSFKKIDDLSVKIQRELCKSPKLGFCFIFAKYGAKAKASISIKFTSREAVFIPVSRNGVSKNIISSTEVVPQFQQLVSQMI
ncbi:hypothetical protein EGR_09376 [Echinococcus granulosus]|uniref:Uncharacterized protein n=1 Tax=Echinococcus granulosus TaxID=6210 RepID=W6U3T5_ECHGR|nr:hypothetical protein EGR_09376 [Echinococcus granulosus]EUB55768.1 hypothetical protein EGR_09376 [Echinococcus granulosus]